MQYSKRYNIFIFFTTFARTSLEVFIPIMLYKKGFDINKILLFLIIVFALNIVVVVLGNYVGNKTSFNLLTFLSVFLFLLMYYLLLRKDDLFLLALLYSANTSFYYLAKHNYAPDVHMKDAAGKISIFMIVAIIAGIPASFIGALLLKLNIYLIMGIVFLIYVVGIIPLIKISTNEHKSENIKTAMKKMPIQNILFFVFTQFKIILFMLFPLYIFIYIKERLDYIGIINIISGIASIIFIYYYAKRMDKKKKDFMFISSTFLSIIIFIELHVSSIILLFTSFLEGISAKMYEVSINRDLYLGHHSTDKSCYFLIFEIVNNLSKLFIVGFFYLLKVNLYTNIIILTIGVFLSGFIKYKLPKEKSL